VPVFFVYLNEFFNFKSLLNNYKKFISKRHPVRTLTDPGLKAGLSAQGWGGLCQKKFAKLPVGPQHFEGRQYPRLKAHGPASVGCGRHMTDSEMLTLPAVGAFGRFCQGGHEKRRSAKVPAAAVLMERDWRVNNACRGRNSLLILQAEWVTVFSLVI
jgi:hypothetical protein